MARPGFPSRRVIVAAALSAILFPAARAQDRVAELQAQFNRETDPVRKAKILPKLGDAQFDQLRRQTDAGDYVQAVRILGDYRNEVKTAETALKATGVDAERKPAGFKQLEIHLRKSLRELDQTILVLPDDQRPPFQDIRQELASIEKELIDRLFPRQPGKNSDQTRPKG